MKELTVIELSEQTGLTRSQIYNLNKKHNLINLNNKINYEYAFQPWVNDLASTNANIHAYYAISSFVVVKSNTPIVKPTVTE